MNLFLSHGLQRTVLLLCCTSDSGLTAAWGLVVAGTDGQEVRLVCVPHFGSTGQLVLLNLATLEVQPHSFDTSFVA